MCRHEFQPGQLPVSNIEKSCGEEQTQFGGEVPDESQRVDQRHRSTSGWHSEEVKKIVISYRNKYVAT